MTPDEYERWLPGNIAEYAAENTKTGRWTPEEAPAKAREEFAGLVPQGMSTPDHVFYSIVRPSDARPVGMLWIQARRPQRRAFIFNVEIFAPFRRKGYATEAMQLLESEVGRMGLTSIGLHVFADNSAARPLYEKLGYEATNINMVKRLE
jgi:RimJ/RimL family protein N-acetyltransferase